MQTLLGLTVIDEAWKVQKWDTCSTEHGKMMLHQQ